MAVYDPEKEKTDLKLSSHEDTGVHPERREAEVADIEKNYAADSTKEPDYARGEKDSLPETQSPWQTNLKASGKSSSSGLKRKATFSLGGVLIAGLIVVIFGILSGPLEIIHFARLLQQFHFYNNEEFMDGRTARLLYKVKNGSVGTAVANTRLGIVSNKFANKIEFRLQENAGLRSVYDSRTGRLVGYEIIDGDKAAAVLGDRYTESPDFNIGPAGSQVRTIDGNTPSGNIVNFRDDNFKTRRAFTRKLNREIHTTKIASSLSSRLLIKRGGVDFHPLKNIRREASDNIVDWYSSRKREKAEARKHGSTRVGGDALGAIETTNSEGAVASDIGAQEAAEEAEELLQEISGIDPDAPDGTSTSSIKKDLLNKFGNAAAVVGVVCTVRSIGDQAEEVQHQNVILPMMRMGMEIVTTGNQVMSGNDVNLDELGSVINDLSDKEKGSWVSARSIQAELGKPLTGPDISPSAKPDSINGKPLVFSIIDSIPGINGVCGIDETIGKIPGISHLGEITGAVVDEALGLFGYSMEEFVGGIVDFLAGDAVNTYATGSELGNLANYGARLAANDQGIAMGGRLLDSSEVAKLDQVKHADIKSDQLSKNFFARNFDIYNTNSFLAKLIYSSPDEPKDIILAISSTPKNLLSAIFKPVGAQSSEYEYGFGEFGFSDEEENDPDYSDPYENADIVENQIGLDILNEEYGECFSMTVDENGIITSGTAKKYDEIPDKCKNPNDTNLTRYRFYLADSLAANSLACYEGDSSSCSNVGMTPEASAIRPVIDDLQCPANLEPNPTQPGYFKMPGAAPNNEYTVYSQTSKRWGSEVLICVIHTVGIAYNQAMGEDSKLRVGNLNTPLGQPSKSHRWGTAVDVSAAGSIQAGSWNKPWKGVYSKEATVLLGKLFVDTGRIKNIWWCPPANDDSSEQIRNHAQSTGKPVNIKCISGHKDHFHVDLKDEYRLQVYSP